MTFCDTVNVSAIEENIGDVQLPLDDQVPTDLPDRPERTDQSEQPEKSERSGRSERSREKSKHKSSRDKRDEPKGDQSINSHKYNLARTIQEGSENFFNYSPLPYVEHF